jgi:SAM-dependent methyltransferase
MASAHLTISSPAAKAELTEADFAEAYVQLRQREGRLMSDEQLRQLPQVGRRHPHYKEWQVRRCSCERLIHYLRQKQGALDILEIGCGNGWLSAQLAANPQWQVTGSDINTTELEQARRVFGHLSNLRFVAGDELKSNGPDRPVYDIVVFAASMQYFHSMSHAAAMSLVHTSLRGEVHIIDTAIYLPEELDAARQRSLEHYTAMGFPQLADRYYHHSLQELEGMQYRLLHRPGRVWKGLRSFFHPFHHLIVKHFYL